MPEPQRRRAETPAAASPPADPAPSCPRLSPLDLLAVIARAEPTLTPESVRLLTAQLLVERGELPAASEDIGVWVQRFKTQHPFVWPAIIGGDARRFAHLLDFASHPHRATEERLRELMQTLGDLSSS